MGLIWNNEYVLEKNKEPHKTGYSSTEATEMADNCFQVWHCSVNEFVLFCGQLTVSFLPFISLSFSHTHTHFFDFLLFAFVFLLSGLHIYPLLGSPNTLFHFPSSQSFFSSSLFSQFHILGWLFTSLLYSLFPFFVLFARWVLTTREFSILLCVVHSK